MVEVTLKELKELRKEDTSQTALTACLKPCQKPPVTPLETFLQRMVENQSLLKFFNRTDFWQLMVELDRLLFNRSCTTSGVYPTESTLLPQWNS